MNSEEFFYLNLIELKGLFKEIDYTHSDFINRLDNALNNKYYLFKYELKNEILTILNNQIYNLFKTLSKFNNNNVAIFLVHIGEIYKNLSKDFNNQNVIYDELIQKYIFDVENYEKRKFLQILDEVDKKKYNRKLQLFDLIALINFKEIKEKDEQN